MQVELTVLYGTSLATAGGAMNLLQLVLTATSAIAAEPEVAVEAEVSPWDGLSVQVYGDAQYVWDWNSPDDPKDTGTVAHRAFEPSTGFGLSFLGIDASYSYKSVGATAALRFGQSTPRLLGDVAPLFLENVKQAYLTFKPIDMIELDLGQFDTIYGAEVAESHKNFNYTRGALYFLMQPFYHTGLRATVRLGEDFLIKGLVVNGVNNPIDDDFSPHLGLQFGWIPDPLFCVYLGYLGATQPNGETFSHFADLVATSRLGDLELVFNADFGAADPEGLAKSGLYYGASLAARYTFAYWLAAALRGELLRDEDGTFYGAPTNLATATVTLEVSPLETRNIIFRLDNRFETSSAPIFPKGGGLMTDMWFSTVFGVVVAIGT
jgi:hypothetical protein